MVIHRLQCEGKDTISAISDRGNNAEARRKKDGSLTVYELKKNIITV